MEASGIELMTFPTGVGTLFDSEQKKNHSVFPEWFLKLVEVNGVEPTLFASEQKKTTPFFGMVFKIGGGERSRTDDLLLARQAL